MLMTQKFFLKSTSELTCISVLNLWGAIKKKKPQKLPHEKIPHTCVQREQTKSRERAKFQAVGKIRGDKCSLEI